MSQPGKSFTHDFFFLPEIPHLWQDSQVSFLWSLPLVFQTMLCFLLQFTYRFVHFWMTVAQFWFSYKSGSHSEVEHCVCGLKSSMTHSLCNWYHHEVLSVFDCVTACVCTYAFTTFSFHILFSSFIACKFSNFFSGFGRFSPFTDHK